MGKFYEGLEEELIVYAQFIAWLQTPVERQVLAGKGTNPEAISRIEGMGSRADDIDYPPCSAGYLITYFFEVGPVLYGGMGPAPLSHTELQAWQSNVGVALSAWESVTLRRMSNAYLGMMDKAKSASCPSPWLEVRDDQAVVATGNHIRGLLRG